MTTHLGKWFALAQRLVHDDSNAGAYLAFMTSPIRLAVLISGGGTTLQNLIERIADGSIKANIVQVISNRAEVGGVERARKAGLPTAIVSRKESADVNEFSNRIFDLCRAARADLVCLAGFLQLLVIPHDFCNRVMNIHPALLPQFGGKGMYGHHVHEAVIAAGASESGCTVHFVDNQYDHGPIILQRSVSVFPNDTADMLATRVFAEECIAYPEAIQLFADGRIVIDGRRVSIRS